LEFHVQTAVVLVVDDNAFIRDLVTETLASFTVVQAASGPEGFAALKARSPDVVLLDVHLGGEIDGIEICRQIRAEADAPPVIFLTGAADPATVEAGYAAGACGYLTKPFSPLELLDSIRAARERPD
jgi:DNA-binding response OmpR family regulator